MPVMRRVMWHGTVRGLAYCDQLRATALAGCEAMSMTPSAYSRLRAGGWTARDILSAAADAGVRLHQLDPLIRWIEPWKPDLPPAAFPYEMLSFTADEFFAFADELEVEAFTAWGAFPHGTLPFQQIVDAFGALCERAAQHGLRCDMEFLPMYGIRTLAEAWAVIDAVGAGNAALVLDAWHYFRGEPDPGLLRSIPGTKIGAVQICDATAAPPPGVPLGLDGQTARRLPGEGAFPLFGLLDLLGETGGLGTVGLEIFSTEFDQMGADAIGVACHDAFDRLFAGEGGGATA